MTDQELVLVADLARIELSPTEIPALAKQLGSILQFMQQLGQLDTNGIEPLVHPHPLCNIYRDDRLGESLPTEVAMANTSSRAGNYFSVPAVMDP